MLAKHSGSERSSGSALSNEPRGGRAGGRKRRGRELACAAANGAVNAQRILTWRQTPMRRAKRGDSALLLVDLAVY